MANQLRSEWAMLQLGSCNHNISRYRYHLGGLLVPIIESPRARHYDSPSTTHH